MTKKFLFAAAVCLMFCVAATSCTKKDKYYFMHQAVDEQKAYDEAKEAGDSEKMTAIKKQMDITAENIKNCIEIEAAAKENKEVKDTNK